MTEIKENIYTSPLKKFKLEEAGNSEVNYY